MPKIRLNKAAKELNISIPRAVEFLQGKGIAIDSNPNALLEPEAFSALEAEFAKDGEQRKASHEVVISKVPETKLEIEEPKAPEVIRAKAPHIKTEAKILGKIDLNPQKPEPKTEPKEEEKPQPEEVPVVETPKEEKPELKVVDKVDLSQLEGVKPKFTKKEKAKEIAPEVQQPQPEPPVQAKEEEAAEEPEKIETQYQKLDGPKILNKQLI